MPVSTLSAALLEEARGSQSPRGSAADRVYAGLRARILSLDLEPDARVARSEIAEAFAVSQSPVREAIHKLVQEGLIVAYPQSRTVVSRIDMEQARQTQFLRRSVEIEVAGELALCGPGDLVRIPAGARHSLRTAQSSGSVWLYGYGHFGDEA